MNIKGDQNAYNDVSVKLTDDTEALYVSSLPENQRTVILRDEEGVTLRLVGSEVELRRVLMAAFAALAGLQVRQEESGTRSWLYR